MKLNFLIVALFTMLVALTASVVTAEPVTVKAESVLVTDAGVDTADIMTDRRIAQGATMFAAIDYGGTAVIKANSIATVKTTDVSCGVCHQSSDQVFKVPWRPINA